jgi:signal transduction histidine kinase/CheY-like chemotaxis protein
MSSSGPPSAEPSAGRLQRCIRDLASLDALVSSCVGRTVEETFDFALDALPIALGCELVLIETPEPHLRRAATWYGQRLGDERLGELLAAASSAQTGAGQLAFGSAPLHWVELDLPVGRERGRLLVARRAPLEGDTDRVLARSAANLVGTALESASVLEAARRKDEFIATLSHEIRNPLAPLRTAVSLLRIAGLAEAARACDIMERQLNHLVRLVDDLLDASRIGRGTLQLRRETVNLADIMRTALEASGPGIRDAGHELQPTIPGSAIWVDGDPVRLGQIFTNLLNNAARFTPRGGRIAFTAEARDDHVLVSVRDNGDGFAPEVAGRLFEMFAKSQRSPGLGIGLSLSRRLAEMHGGGIEAHSDGPGQGAEFVVRLPTTVAPNVESRAPAPIVRMRPAGDDPLRVLVADDNTDSAELLSLLFSELGCEVSVAHDGEAAVQIAQTIRPDLAILDIGMPFVDGYEAARRIREDAAGRPLTLVAMTGWGQEEDRRLARDAGFDHHLLKPVDVEKLGALLEAVRAKEGRPTNAGSDPART